MTTCRPAAFISGVNVVVLLRVCKYVNLKLPTREIEICDSPVDAGVAD